jgi:microcystin degradation protein MlrC
MSYRIAIAEISHESNTFCTDATKVEAFKQYMWLQGDEIVREHAGNRTYLGGMLESAGDPGISPLPVFATTAEPSGIISAGAYEEMVGTLLAGLERAMPLAAVCLALHGAGVVEGIDDLEGAVLSAVRELVGPRVPIVATLDLHGNVTEKMVDVADGLFGVNLYPHTDSFDRGSEAMTFLHRLLRGEIAPAMHLERLPMLMPLSSTDVDPARRLNSLCWDWEQRPGMLDCTIFHGFPYTDVPVVGTSVLAITNGDAAAAHQAATAVAAAVWDAREEFRPRPIDAAQAIAEAQRIDDGLVVVNDASDNPGGGAPGDGTHLLRAMLTCNLQDACYGFIYDPETAQQAARSGVGTTIGVRLGGKTDALHGRPIEAPAYVKAVTDGRFRLTTPMGRGMRVDLGLMARLRIGRVDVLVSSQRRQVLDDEVFLLHGIDVRRYRIVGVKSSIHFRAGFAHLARVMIAADTPGATTARLERFQFQRIRRPMWPLDAAAVYPD